MTHRRSDTPAWVLARMESQGLPRDSRAGRPVTHRRLRAVPRWCECGRAVYAGQVGGVDLLLDPAPVGEGLAIMDGRWTVMLYPDLTMIRRRAVDIRLSTADDYWICIEHRCAGPLPLVNTKYEPVKISDERPPY